MASGAYGTRRKQKQQRGKSALTESLHQRPRSRCCFPSTSPASRSRRGTSRRPVRDARTCVPLSFVLSSGGCLLLAPWLPPAVAPRAAVVCLMRVTPDSRGANASGESAPVERLGLPSVPEEFGSFATKNRPGRLPDFRARPSRKRAHSLTRVLISLILIDVEVVKISYWAVRASIRVYVARAPPSNCHYFDRFHNRFNRPAPSSTKPNSTNSGRPPRGGPRGASRAAGRRSRGGGGPLRPVSRFVTFGSLNRSWHQRLRMFVSALH